MTNNNKIKRSELRQIVNILDLLANMYDLQFDDLENQKDKELAEEARKIAQILRSRFHEWIVAKKEMEKKLGKKINIHFYNVIEANKAAELLGWSRHHQYGSLEFTVTESRLQILRENKIGFYIEPKTKPERKKEIK